MAYRSAGQYGYADDFRKGGESWDRDRLERVGRHVGEYGSNIDRRPQRPTRFEEPDPYYDDGQRYSGRFRRPDFLAEPEPPELSNRALAPYRRKSITERDVDLPSRRPPRPRYIRRQSSLDTFDRRPMPRYGDHMYEEKYPPPRNAPVPIPIRSREPYYPAPPRHYHEHEYESIHYHHDSSDSDSHHKIHIHRDRSRGARSMKPKSVRSSSSSSSSGSEQTTTTKRPEKRGKTRMPKRLVRKEVIIKLGYPYAEEDDCFVIQRALAKEQIDEVIETSKTYKESRKTYRYEESEPSETIVVAAVPEAPVQASEVVHKTFTKEFYEPPAPHHHHHVHEPVPVAPPAHHHHVPEPVVVAPPAHHHDIIEPGPVVIEPPHHHNHYHGHTHRNDREIHAEIRALEAEKRALQLEREAEKRLVLADRVREGDSVSGYEVAERKEKERDVVRVEKDKKGRLALVRSNH